jgi:hypothetical protein
MILFGFYIAALYTGGTAGDRGAQECQAPFREHWGTKQRKKRPAGVHKAAAFAASKRLFFENFSLSTKAKFRLRTL